MGQLIHYTTCPVCASAAIKNVLSVKDFTVSKETFTVVECGGCTFRFTQDVPDANDIGRYYQSDDYISHTNTSKGLINRLYQAVRKRTIAGKRKLVQQFTGLEKGTLLDVGSGTGVFAGDMKRNGWTVTGLEPDAGARNIAKEVNDIVLGNIEQFHQQGIGPFDAITMWHVLEHVHDLQGYTRRLNELLKEKGKLFIAVPNYTSADAVIYKEYWAAYDVPRHLYHFSPRSMQVLMEQHGLQIEQYKPMWYDSFYISLLSSKYKNGKANLAGAFLNGFRSNMKAWGDVKKCSSVVYVISKKV
jgi:2-polyprenyl-3-methyl-5-hydroxy-6-metoxy-1,4-benzoquinol methylase